MASDKKQSSSRQRTEGNDSADIVVNKPWGVVVSTRVWNESSLANERKARHEHDNSNENDNDDTNEQHFWTANSHLKNESQGQKPMLSPRQRMKHRIRKRTTNDGGKSSKLSTITAEYSEMMAEADTDDSLIRQNSRDVSTSSKLLREKRSSRHIISSSVQGGDDHFSQMSDRKRYTKVYFINLYIYIYFFFLQR
ncbi:hypothetical protein RFI_04610 [Reticulomyxa filosa]|uniref:Uncharacterized protein n=1 Tax=Reticulomyxa filosa TaxID=46433 RepID=X6P2Q5_RETFI|nr:hypothetical protein RFI_04610 [Reticulomyxa filosa]|eukprot:ETO32506.1 hypothetical protein RFI_04610 [Reticulomyxa filosa]